MTPARQFHPIFTQNLQIDTTNLSNQDVRFRSVENFIELDWDLAGLPDLTDQIMRACLDIVMLEWITLMAMTLWAAMEIAARDSVI